MLSRLRRFLINLLKEKGFWTGVIVGIGLCVIWSIWFVTEVKDNALEHYHWGLISIYMAELLFSKFFYGFLWGMGGLLVLSEFVQSEPFALSKPAEIMIPATILGTILLGIGIFIGYCRFYRTRRNLTYRLSSGIFHSLCKIP